MLIEIDPGPFDLILDKARDPGGLFGHMSVHGHKKGPEEIGQHFLVSPGAVDELVPHSAEESFVFPGNAGMKNVAVRGDLIMLQDVANLPAREMDEPYLGLIRSVIKVVLDLSGLVEDHVAGRDDDLLIVQYKVALTGRDIYDLPVHPAPWPQGGKLGPCIKLIGPCA